LIFTVIYKYFNENPFLYRTKIINDLLKLIEKIVISIKSGNNQNIWNIAVNNSDLSLNILNTNNGFKEM